MATLLDSYSETNQTTSLGIYGGGREGVGQSFTNDNEITLDSCKFFAKRQGNPTGNVYAKLFAHKDTYGVNGSTDGAALATSDAVDITGVTNVDYALIEFTFSDANRITLNASTYYVICVEFEGGASNAYFRVGTDAEAPLDHDGLGQMSYDVGTADYDDTPSHDIPFYVYGEDAGVSVTPAAATAIGSVTAPTVVKGSLSISSLVATAIAAVVAPVVILGSMAVTPAAAASAIGSVTNPTVVHGNVAVTPTAASAIGAVTAPDVLRGSTSATPTAASAIGAVTAPTVVHGDVAVTPTAASAIGAVTNPTVIEGSGNVSVTPTAASAIGAVTNPTVLYGSTSATPTAASAIGAVTAPTVVHGSTSATPTAASAIGSVTNPTVIEGGGPVSVTPAAATAVGSVTAPTVVLGSTSSTPSAASAIGSVTAPTVVHGSLTLTTTAASAIGSVTNPTVIHGSVAVTSSAATAVGAVTAPTVVLGSTAATPAAATAVGAVANPTVTITSPVSYNIRKSVYNALSGDSDVTSIAGTRIYWIQMPQGVTYPAVTFETLPTAGRVHLMGADSALKYETLRVTTWGTKANFFDMETATGYIKALLQDHTGELGGAGGIDVERIFLTTGQPTIYNAGVNVYQISQYFTVWYQEA